MWIFILIIYIPAKWVKISIWLKGCLWRLKATSQEELRPGLVEAVRNTRCCRFMILSHRPGKKSEVSTWRDDGDAPGDLGSWDAEEMQRPRRGRAEGGRRLHGRRRSGGRRGQGWVQMLGTFSRTWGTAAAVAGGAVQEQVSWDISATCQFYIVNNKGYS